MSYRKTVWEKSGITAIVAFAGCLGIGLLSAIAGWDTGCLLGFIGLVISGAALGLIGLRSFVQMWLS